MTIAREAASVSAAGAVSAPMGGLRKELNLFDGVAIVVGTTIGSGIFLIPHAIALQLDSLAAVLSVWVAGGMLSLFGALSLAELGSIFPGTGGLCTYLRHAYGRLPAFLYAWSLLAMIHTGSIAALAVAFGLYFGQALQLTTIGQKAASIFIIVALTVISCWGIRGGKLVQNLIAIAKVGGLAVILIVLGAKGSLRLPLAAASATSSGPAFSFAGFGIALIAVLWAYEGWHVVSFVAGEFKRPQRDLPRSLFYGSAILLFIFIAANLGYYHALTAAEIRGSETVAATAILKTVGPSAAFSVSVLILISIVGAMNGLILTGPRVYYAMACDGLFPSIFGRIGERTRVPLIALIVQGAWAAALAISGTYQQLFTDVVFTAWIFYGLAVAAVLVLRRTQPQLPRAFRVPGYPWFSALFCVAAAGLVLSNLIARPRGAALGLGLVAVGIPLYFVCNKPRAASPNVSPASPAAPAASKEGYAE